jgi:hypothetical protein
MAGNVRSPTNTPPMPQRPHPDLSTERGDPRRPYTDGGKLPESRQDKGFVNSMLGGAGGMADSQQRGDTRQFGAMARTAPAVAPSGVVPREYVGLARALWLHVQAEHQVVKPAQEQLIALLEELKPRRGFRQRKVLPTLRVVAAKWRALPATARLAFKVTGSGDRFSLAEVRVIPSKMRMADWDESELALALRLTEIECRRRKLSIKRRPLGDACLHALARRYQRGEDRSDDSVLEDMWALADAFPQQAPAGGDFRVATRDGYWVGELVQYDGQPFLTARTFVD